jgi:hypothetical protein
MPTIDDILTSTGPVASVYLRAPSDTSDAERRFEIRWKNARRDLAADPAADAVLPALDRTMADVGHADAAALALFASAEGAVAEPLDDEIADDLAVVDRLPRLVPLLHAEQRSVPHVMVMTDRTGADIIAVADGRAVDVDSVDGETLHIHRGRFGGWSHRRFQQRAENRWESNAREVAARVEETARDIGARLVTVAGDVRACQLLREHLADDVAAITTVLEVGDPDLVADETVRLVADVVTRDTREVLREHAEKQAHALAVSGPGPVLSALSTGRVATLLVVDDAEDDRRAWFADDESPVCSASRAFEGMVEGRLVDVAVRAALLGDADVRVVPGTVIEGNLGAILRW